MLEKLDDFLNGITMYRLMLYCLIFLVLVSVVLGSFRLIPFNPLSIISTAIIFVLTCWITNKILAKVFKAFTNLESVYITALILTLIVTPLQSDKDIILIILIAFLSQASKYILAINRKHLFNPAAFAVVVSSILGYEASWWAGTSWITPFLLLVGFLIVRKVQRLSLVISFLLISILLLLSLSFTRGFNIVSVLQSTFLESPILFFVFIMLTEPLTTPSKRKWQVLYGGLVGFLYVFIIPEIALILGNIFSYLISPKGKFFLKLKEKIKIAPDIYDFIFEQSEKRTSFIFDKDQRLDFEAGQYMEWTLAHNNPDNRGVRRYFTIAASPTENNLRIGVKFYPNSSTFKKTLLNKKVGDQILAGQLGGEFTLPKDSYKKLCFVAGGIGVTPYRSIIKYLLDTGNKWDIILLYFSKSKGQFVYKEIFDQAYKKFNMKTIYLTKRFDADLIKKEVKDYKDRIFYISGPHSMVDSFQDNLLKMGILGRQIKVDFFPGYV